MEYQFIAEKVFYNVTIETETESNDCRLELLTGDFNDNNYDELISCLSWFDLPEQFNCHAVTMSVIDSIRDNWDSPETVYFPGSRDTDHIEVTITIERETAEPSFNHSGCDLCNDGMGNSVYDCIGYDDASKINEGNYHEIEVCGDCLCNYHNGTE